MKTGFCFWRGKIGALAALLAAIGLIVGGALAGFELVATDAKCYIDIQERLDIYRYAGIDKAELDPLMEDVAEYLRGERAELDREVTLLGARQAAFNARERAHMEDVAALFRLERRVRTWAIALGCAALAAAVWLTGKRCAMTFAYTTLAAALALLGAVGLCAARGFEKVFYRFHELFFTNDLWLLDPATDAMIRMYPQEFFEHIVLRIGVAAGAGALLALAAGFACVFLFRRIAR